jgi:hypothetical protein
MAEALVTYKKQNKFDKYFDITSSEKAKIDDLVAMFAKELTTKKGTNLFDRNYGSSFIDDISDYVNIYKIQWFFDNKYNDLYEKYGITEIEASDATFSRTDGFLNISIKIGFKDVALEHYINFLYNGIFTENTIIEMD